MHQNKENKKVKTVSKKLVKQQCEQEPEMYHLPTDGKKLGELEDFQKSLDNNPQKKEKAKVEQKKKPVNTSF